jgi:hypothetical protein
MRGVNKRPLGSDGSILHRPAVRESSINGDAARVRPARWSTGV